MTTFLKYLAVFLLGGVIVASCVANAIGARLNPPQWEVEQAAPVQQYRVHVIGSTPVSEEAPARPEAAAELTAEEVASLVGGDADYWIAPNWEQGAWIYQGVGSSATLVVPEGGALDVWAEGCFTRIKEGSFTRPAGDHHQVALHFHPGHPANDPTGLPHWCGGQ